MDLIVGVVFEVHIMLPLRMNNDGLKEAKITDFATFNVLCKCNQDAQDTISITPTLCLPLLKIHEIHTSLMSPINSHIKLPLIISNYHEARLLNFCESSNLV